jgi:hypothetical protein
MTFGFRGVGDPYLASGGELCQVLSLTMILGMSFNFLIF